MFEISNWYNNFQTPAVLMIDDLSDAYIDVYEESHKNDWGYLCDLKGSAFHFLHNKLLSHFPYIKITFFVPYLKHNVINDNSLYSIKKYALGERNEYREFLLRLIKQGHEIAHHGSNHGKYINEENPIIDKNWVHEWLLFDSIEIGMKTTLNGVKEFKKICNINIIGGKYCGYQERGNSQEIIDKCDFLYWCDKPISGYSEKEKFFGENNIIAFPTNFAGSSFVRLKYFTGDKQRDRKKKIFKYLQPLYSLYSYIKLYRMYVSRHIISIQEHISPSTTAGTVQSLNIVSDIKSLKKIFKFLKRLNIWYANCQEIANYIYVRENCELIVKKEKIIINFINNKKVINPVISIINDKAFTLEKNNQILKSIKNNNRFVINVTVTEGQNIFNIRK